MVCSGKCEETLSLVKNILSKRLSVVYYLLESFGGGVEITNSTLTLKSLVIMKTNMETDICKEKSHIVL